MNKIFYNGSIRTFFKVKLNNNTIKFVTRTTHYDNYKKWIPYCEWDEHFAESYPMQSYFKIPTVF